MIRKIILSLTLISCLIWSAAHAQDNPSIGYQKKYDEPYNLNKLFVHLQPLFGDVAATNMVIGIGLEADYFLENHFDFGLNVRSSYGQATDLVRDAAAKNAANAISPNSYLYFELGGTYHWKDFELDKPVKVFLHEEQNKGNLLASKVIPSTEVTSLLRRIYGARLGGMFNRTTFDLNRAMDSQNIRLVNGEGIPLDSTLSYYGNLSTAGFYLGASLSWIRNFSVEFEETYEPGGDDLILTAFFDVMIAPSISVSDISYNSSIYSSEPLGVSKFGFRGGVEGKFNRDLSWAYGAEIGYRPSVKKQGFFLLFKLSFPVFGSDLKKNSVDTTDNTAENN